MYEIEQTLHITYNLVLDMSKYSILNGDLTSSNNYAVEAIKLCESQVDPKYELFTPTYGMMVRR